MKVFSSRPLMIGLLIVTACALAWNTWGMNRRMVLDASSTLAVEALDDRGDNNHGASVASAKKSRESMTLDCHLVQRSEWPFCELRMQVGRSPTGVDLSAFESVRIVASVHGPGNDHRLRLFLRTFIPGISSTTDDDTLKVQEVIFDPGTGMTAVDIPMSHFSVAGWWLEEHPVPLADSQADMSRIVDLLVATGTAFKTGDYRIAVQRIELTGKWISPATFRLAVIAAWMALMMTQLVIDALGSRRQLKRMAMEERRMAAVNASLQAQTMSLSRLATRDPLTDLLNRAGFLGSLYAALAEATGPQRGLSIVFMDIDHFKRINDTWGHGFGDAVLQRIGGLVGERMRQPNLCARWGGEEFVVACIGTSAADAVRLADRLREDIASERWRDDVQVTCSFGVTERAPDEPLDATIARADDALYRAKHGGRNRVEYIPAPDVVTEVDGAGVLRVGGTGHVLEAQGAATLDPLHAEGE